MHAARQTDAGDSANMLGRPVRILVVEDERIVALDLTTTLRRLGYQVEDSVATGEQAVDVALRAHPDLVLMDIRLAGVMDGIAAAHAIVAAIDAPIIYLTAHSDDETLRRVKTSRPYSYLLKPFRADDLRCAIEVTLNRHAVDAALRDQERWLRTTLNSIHDGIVATDREDRIQYVNPVAESMTGCPSEQSIGRKLHDIVYLLNEATGAAIGLGTGIQRNEAASLRSNDGRELAVEPSAAAIRGDDGAALGRVIVLRDVAEQRAALREIARLNADLETRVTTRTLALQDANKELDAFSYSLAHDLRSPLRAIDGYVQSVLEDFGGILQGDAREMLLKVRATAQRASRLIVELLALAHLSQCDPKLEAIDLSVMAAHIGDDLQADHSKGEVEFTVAPNLHVVGDHGLVHVVLANLLANAWKFSAEQPVPRIELGMQKEAARTIFYVKDNGVGFDMRDGQRIFGTFERLHGERFAGDGVGLALVSRALKRMHGRIWMQSAPGRGATFYFEIGGN